MNHTDRADPAIQRVFSTFDGLIELAGEFLRKKQYLPATASAQIASLYASYNHPGEFSSPKLERILSALGRSAVETRPLPKGREAGNRNSDAAVLRVLHVLTGAKEVGGDSRFVWRWIHRDAGRRHSVALTYQLDFEVPTPLAEAVALRNGTVHVLDRGRADPIQRAAALRQIAKDADVVFLHVYPEDVVPALAFADKTDLPPIVFVAQADHQYWTGVSMCDWFVHLRESGMQLSEQRRGIERARMASLPIPLELKARTSSRAEAKVKLGLSSDVVVLLSIARALKYKPIGGEPGLADVMVPIINAHANTVLLVVGPADADEWQAARERTGGRIRALGQRSDTQLFYEAADVYLDSFPFTSNTSLLEAGGFGVPLLSYFPYRSESAVLGPGAPGLDDHLIRARNLGEYETAIATLIADADFRAKKGESTRHGVTFMHVGDGWNQALEEVYGATRVATPTERAHGASDESRSGEIDVLLNRFHSQQVPLGWAISWYARRLPYRSRLQLLTKMLRLDRSFPFSLFLPDWVQRTLGGRLGGWRRLPLLGRWLSSKA